MKSSFAKIIALFLMAWGANLSSLAAETSNITSVHPQEMRQIAMLHRKADELVMKNDFRGAIRAYSDILLIEPDDETAYTGMGQAYMILGDYGRAKDAFQNALHIDPDNDTAAFGLQKIMDPDGVAGMVTPSELEKEEAQTQSQDEKPSAENVPKISAPPAPARHELKALPPSKETTLLPAEALLGLKKISLSSSDKPLPPSQAILTLNQASTAQINKPLPPSPIPVNRKTALRPVLNPSPQNIQNALKKAGLYPGAVDGDLNSAGSQKAIKNFQLENHLEVDGKVGPKTWMALQKYLAG